MLNITSAIVCCSIIIYLCSAIEIINNYKQPIKQITL